MEHSYYQGSDIQEYLFLKKQIETLRAEIATLMEELKVKEKNIISEIKTSGNSIPITISDSEEQSKCGISSCLMKIRKHTRFEIIGFKTLKEAMESYISKRYPTCSKAELEEFTESASDHIWNSRRKKTIERIQCQILDK